MITYFEGLPSASNRTINRRGDYCHSPDTPLFKGNQKRLASLSLQKKSPRKALVKINKNRFPKDFFPPSPGFQSLPMSARLAKFGGLVNESKESNQQTLDTPAPSSRVTNFEEATLFNKTSFFGAEQLVSQTIQVGGDVRYFSNEKKSLSKSKQKGKLTAMPSMHKSSSHHFKLDDLYNCTFSRDFSSGLASPTKSIDCPTQGLMKYQSKEERQKQLKDSRVLMERDDKEQMKRRKKWSQFLNMELLVVDGECHPNEQGRGNFRLRKKALLSNRPASLLPKIYS